MFEVDKVINGNTIVVKPSWILADTTGNEIIIRGYEPVFKTIKQSHWSWKDIFRKRKEENTPEWAITDAGIYLANELAKKRLEELLLGKHIELINKQTESGDCITPEGKAKLRVTLNGVDVSNYFPDFKN